MPNTDPAMLTPQNIRLADPCTGPLNRPVLVCPSCYGITERLDMTGCPDCVTELLARVPVTAATAKATSAATSLGWLAPALS